jgi:hypothetical protein
MRNKIKSNLSNIQRKTQKLNKKPRKQHKLKNNKKSRMMI